MSIRAVSTFGNASMKNGVTPVPRFSEWPEISTSVCTEAVSQYEHGQLQHQAQLQFTQQGGILPQRDVFSMAAKNCNGGKGQGE